MMFEEYSDVPVADVSIEDKKDSTVHKEDVNHFLKKNNKLKKYKKMKKKLKSIKREKKILMKFVECLSRQSAPSQSTQASNNDTGYGKKDNQDQLGSKKEKRFLEKLGDSFLKVFPSILRTIVTTTVSAIFGHHFRWNRRYGRNTA